MPAAVVELYVCSADVGDGVYRGRVVAAGGATNPAEEDVGERLVLVLVRLAVDEQGDRPRRTGSVVVIGARHHHLPAAEVGVLEVSLVDRPGEGEVAYTK